jgi:hypothetical protein
VNTVTSLQCRSPCAIVCVRHAAITSFKTLSVKGPKTGVSTYTINLILIFVIVQVSVVLMLQFWGRKLLGLNLGRDVWILTDIFLEVSQFLQTNIETVARSNHDLFLPNSFQFIIDPSSYQSTLYIPWYWQRHKEYHHAMISVKIGQFFKTL